MACMPAYTIQPYTAMVHTTHDLFAKNIYSATCENKYHMAGATRLKYSTNISIVILIY